VNSRWSGLAPAPFLLLVSRSQCGFTRLPEYFVLRSYPIETRSLDDV
jgi:hypothetical protein